MNKPFSRELYQSYDEKARQAVFDIFKRSILWSVEDSEDKYGVDLLLFKGIHKVGGLELEVKTGWVGREFPFPDVQFLSRKDHYSNTLWVLFNRDCTAHLTAKMSDILTCPKRIVPNKYLQEEVFYVVPLSKVVMGGLYRIVGAVDKQT